CNRAATGSRRAAGGTGERVAYEPAAGRAAARRPPVVGSGPAGSGATPTPLRGQGPLPLGQDPPRVGPASVVIQLPFDPNVHLGPITLAWHGIFTAVGIFFGVALPIRLLRGRVREDDAYAVAWWGVIGGIVGARVVHVIDQFSYYAAHPELILAIWTGGIAIWGAAIGGVIGGYIPATRRTRSDSARIRPSPCWYSPRPSRCSRASSRGRGSRSPRRSQPDRPPFRPKPPPRFDEHRVALDLLAGGDDRRKLRLVPLRPLPREG